MSGKISKIAVLTSGMSRGSNLTAMHSWFRANAIPVEISFVVVTRSDAPVIEKCRELGLEVCLFPSKDMTAFEESLAEKVLEYDIDLIALAGFLKRLSSSFLSSIKIPVLNIHPALLPKYGGKGMYGINVHREVFGNKEQESGVSIHFVNDRYDAGEIILQSRVTIGDCQTPEEIAARVLSIEHSSYAPAIWSVLQKNNTE